MLTQPTNARAILRDLMMILLKDLSKGRSIIAVKIYMTDEGISQENAQTIAQAMIDNPTADILIHVRRKSDEIQ